MNLTESRGKKTKENGSKYSCKKHPTYTWQQTHPEGKDKKKKNILKSDVFISMQKGKNISISFILNNQIVLSQLCVLGNVFKGSIIIFNFAYGHR